MKNIQASRGMVECHLTSVNAKLCTAADSYAVIANVLIRFDKWTHSKYNKDTKDIKTIPEKENAFPSALSGCVVWSDSPGYQGVHTD